MARIAALTEGRALLQECRIANNGLSGVLVGVGGEAHVAECRIDGNGHDSIEVAPGGLLRKG